MADPLSATFAALGRPQPRAILARVLAIGETSSRAEPRPTPMLDMTLEGTRFQALLKGWKRAG